MPKVGLGRKGEKKNNPPIKCFYAYCIVVTFSFVVAYMFPTVSYMYKLTHTQAHLLY